MIDAIEIQTRLKRLNRSQKYLSKIFRKPESHISTAIAGLNEDLRFILLREKIINHIIKLEGKVK